jgi:predicted P-loop ATPase/GTPase
MAKKADKTPAKTAKSQKAVGSTGSSAEQIGFHKGCVMTLAKERQELVRILGIVEQLMQMHASALQELGVPLDSEVQNAVSAPSEQPKPKKPPIEDIL